MGIQGVKVLFSPARRGKLHAVERVMPQVRTPVVIFSDANTLLPENALLDLVSPFADAKVGAVAGEKRVASNAQAAGQGEGAYWKYESALKRWDAMLSSAMGAAGELFAIRTALFQPVPSDTLIEDFVQSMQVVAQGYRLAYAPEAYALETASASVEEEMKRKVRIAAGGIQASYRLRGLLNPFKYGWVSWQLLSHRVLRWTLAPLALPIILISNVLLLSPKIDIYALSLFMQLAAYQLAFMGWMARNRQVKIKAFFVPFYFAMMNVCVYKGALRLIRKKQSVVWEKAERMPLPYLHKQ
jgi:cellulose synthase/poly-beta-1,6-N-acetylglucosamine synthase-like glycosyltransferase